MLALRRAQRLSRDEFGRLYLEAQTRVARAEQARVERCLVQLVDPVDSPAAAALGLRRAGSELDAITSCWVDPDEPPRLVARGELTAILGTEARRTVGAVYAYAVDERVHWSGADDAGDADAAGRCTLVSLLRRRPEISHAAFVDSCCAHAERVREQWPAVVGYVQNFVACIATPGAPEIHAVEEIRFASDQELCQHLQRDPSGTRVLAASAVDCADVTASELFVARIFPVTGTVGRGR